MSDVSISVDIKGQTHSLSTEVSPDMYGKPTQGDVVDMIDAINELRDRMIKVIEAATGISVNNTERKTRIVSEF